MADTLSPEHRSWLMSRVRGKDTKPEIYARKAIFALGYRYRLHDKTLPGTPDIVLKSRKKAIFVHGCFWHGHRKCSHATTPKTNKFFWIEKISMNRRRDSKNERKLRSLGWNVMTVWECQLRDSANLNRRIIRFLG